MRSRRRERFAWKIALPIALILVVGLVAVVLLRPTAPQAAAPTQPACPRVADVVVGTISVPAGPIEGYCQAALVNAAQIIRAANRWTADDRAKDIGVMVAIGESNLQNLNYGDTAGPDSRGLFQQRSNWGPLADRMNPYTAAYNFFQRLLGIVGWQTLAPTAAAHIVQGNANPNYYAPYYPRAQRMVAALLADQIPPPLAASPTPLSTPPGKP
ncbi:MAG TPA: hypothetical protein VHZ81_08050 [Galbitalea sp.]|nr:hypothetical protein [Galbitalea sp.]